LGDVSFDVLIPFRLVSFVRSVTHLQNNDCFFPSLKLEVVREIWKEQKVISGMAWEKQTSIVSLKTFGFIFCCFVNMQKKDYFFVFAKVIIVFDFHIIKTCLKTSTQQKLFLSSLHNTFLILFFNLNLCTYSFFFVSFSSMKLESILKRNSLFWIITGTMTICISTIFVVFSWWSIVEHHLNTNICP
jgi:hypothetical protein